MIKHILLILIVGLLSACNYHLRGSAEIPEMLKFLNVQSASPLLYKSFKESLQTAGGQLIDKPDPKGVIVKVVNERFERRSLSLSSTGKASEFELVYDLSYEVWGSAGQLFVPLQQIKVRRNYFNDQQDIIGKSNEENIIRQEMYQQAVRELMERGRALLKANQK